MTKSEFKNFFRHFRINHNCFGYVTAEFIQSLSMFEICLANKLDKRFETDPLIVRMAEIEIFRK